jgi:hypothetical protein
MNALLARAGLIPRADYRAVFRDFAEGLSKVLTRRAATARVRVVEG